MVDNYGRDELIALGPTGEVVVMSDGHRSFVLRSDEEAADLIIGSDWFKNQLAGAYDQGVAIAGRYGHEDYWDEEDSPYNDNPWRDEPLDV